MTTSPSTINAKIRNSIIQRLPGAIETAMKSYMHFIDAGLERQLDPPLKDKQDKPDEQDIKIDETPYQPKNFKSHHDACKVAIAHINLLIDLANGFIAQISAEEGNIEAANTLTTQVQKALHEMEKRTSNKV